MRSSARVVVFLKAPVAGSVKTRLASSIGPKAAAAAYVELVTTLLNSLSSWDNLELRFTPDDAGLQIQPWVRKDWDLHPQGQGALGLRLSRAVQDNLAGGHQKVLLIGSDCPTVTIADLRAGEAGLDSHDVVAGPAHDGGYWLLGLQAPHPELFSGIDWSTPRVWGQTLAKARAAGLTVHALKTKTDVDTEAEWLAFQAGRR